MLWLCESLIFYWMLSNDYLRTPFNILHKTWFTSYLVLISRCWMAGCPSCHFTGPDIDQSISIPPLTANSSVVWAVRHQYQSYQALQACCILQQFCQLFYLSVHLWCLCTASKRLSISHSHLTIASSFNFLCTKYAAFIISHVILSNSDHEWWSALEEPFKVISCR